MMRQEYIGSLREEEVSGREFVLIDLSDAVWDQVEETIVLELLPFSYMLSYLPRFEPQVLLRMSPIVLL